jgi:hypothetical protein
MDEVMKAWMWASGVGIALAALIGCSKSGSDDTQSGNGALSAGPTAVTNPVACAGTSPATPIKATIACSFFVGTGDPVELKADANNSLTATLGGFQATVFSRVQADRTDFSLFQAEIRPVSDTSATVVTAKGSAAMLQALAKDFDDAVLDWVPTSKEDEMTITCKVQ